MIDLVATSDRHLNPPEAQRGIRLPEALTTLARNKWNVLRSSVIGTFVGALPGAGGSIAGLVAYSEARRSAKDSTAYGKGEPGGVIATESANNATVGGGFIPTLVLGIPGTPPDAVILGALLVQGVRTGPTLFTDGANIVYTFIFGLLLATILMLPVGLLIGRFAYGAIVRAPKSALVPIVAFMTVIGAFAIRNSLSDVLIMIVLGIVGWVASKRGFSVSPIVLGLILGRIAEQGFVQSWTIGEALGDLWGQFFGRPLSLVIIAMTLITFVYPFLPKIRALLRGANKLIDQQSERAPGRTIIADLTSLLVFGIIASVVLVQSGSLNAEAAVFPRTIAWGMAVFVLIAIVRLLTTRHVSVTVSGGSVIRRAAVPIVMLATVGLVPLLGFGAAGAIMGLVLIFVAQYEKLTVRATCILVACVVAVITAFTLGFRNLLDVPLPSGLF